MITMHNGLTASKEYQSQLNSLMMDIFGFSFEAWQARNLWGPDYESYSIVRDGNMVANVSVYQMHMLVNGQRRELIQIGAVATRPEYRGQGLSRQLFEHIFRVYSGVPAFLFGGDSVREFYPRFGFVPQMEKQPYVRQSLHTHQGTMRSVTMTDPVVDGYLRNRKQFSQVLDCLNQYSVNWFHVLLEHGEHLYELPDLGALIIAEQNGTSLTLYDVVAAEPVDFRQLVEHLSFPGVETILFGFNPDWLGVEYQMRDYQVEDSTLFVKGDLGVDQEFIIPLLIRT